MKKILLLHGPNLNWLGKRDAKHYGTITLQDIEKLCQLEAKKNRFELIAYQSNHEGDLIDKLQEVTQHCTAIIINAGALTHYSYAIHDALLDANLLTVEVHLSNILEREPWRRHSVISAACDHVIQGKKEQGYIEAIQYLSRQLT